jgi:S1-C subfamily serine protease
MVNKIEMASNPVTHHIGNLWFCVVFILHLAASVFVLGFQDAHAETDEGGENLDPESPSNYTIRSEEGVLVIYDASGNVVLRNDGHAKVSLASPEDPLLFVTVQAGQTLSQIASQYPGITTQRLMLANEFEDANLIRIGDKIWIPTMDGVCHRVRPGETLKNIVENYRIADVTAVCEVNGLSSPQSHLKPGTLIVIPAIAQKSALERGRPRISDFIRNSAHQDPSLADRIQRASTETDQTTAKTNDQSSGPPLTSSSEGGNRPRRSFFNPPLEPAEIAKRSLPSVVLLVMEDSHGQPLGMGSGFLVAPGMVATNAHVVGKAARGYAKLTGQSDVCDVKGYFSIDNKCDLCLLSVPDLVAEPLPIGNPNEVAIGDEIYAVGNPQGLEGTFSAGIVSAIRHLDQETVLQITAPISPGSSGGPVLNKFGQVIGIATAIMSGGQNLNFAIPANYLSELEQISQEVHSLVSISNVEIEASLIEKLGDNSIEGLIATHFQWTYGNDGYFSFSLRNTLRLPVQNVQYLVIFYDPTGAPVDCVEGKHDFVIRGGLVDRHYSTTSSSVRKIVSKDYTTEGTDNIEFRILDFKIVDPSEHLE